MEEKYITASCSISKGVVRKNDKVLFKGEDHSVHDFLLSVYKHFNIDYPKFYKMDNLSKLGFSGNRNIDKRNSLDKGKIQAR